MFDASDQARSLVSTDVSTLTHSASKLHLSAVGRPLLSLPSKAPSKVFLGNDAAETRFADGKVYLGLLPFDGMTPGIIDFPPKGPFLLMSRPLSFYVRLGS